MKPYEKLNLVLNGVAKYTSDEIKGITYPTFSYIMLLNHPELAPKYTWDALLMTIVDRLEVEEYIKHDLISTTHSSGKQIGEYWLRVTDKGEQLIKQGGYTKETKFLEITDSDLRMLSLFLSVMPYYERFSTLELQGELGSYYTYEDRLTMFNSGIEQRIADFLYKHGFSRKEKDYEVVLTDKGRELKEAGDYEAYLKIDEDATKAVKEKKEREIELLKYQKENAKWQRYYGNRISAYGIVIALLSLFTTWMITIYLKSKPAPIVVHVQVDSTFNSQPQKAKIDISKYSSPEK